MISQDDANEVMDYLIQTFRIRGVSERTKLQGFIEGYDRDVDEFVVSPWDVEQVALNTAVSDSKMVREAVSKFPEILAIEDSPGKISVIKASSEDLAEYGHEATDNNGSPQSITVGDAFKWYLYHKIEVLSNSGDKPVGISDGVFAIKNELFLPDDFVPRAMMEMVEGSKVVDVIETLKNLQPSGQSNVIYMFAKHHDGEHLEPHWFYYRPHLSGKVPQSLDKLGEKIASSFADFQKTNEYENFLFSRVMRNVIFTVETKKKRTLGKPLFDPGKLKLLERKGIVILDGNVGAVPENISIDQLKQMKAEAEESAGKVSDIWMSSMITL